MLTIELSPEEGAALAERATRASKSVPAYVRDVLGLAPEIIRSSLSKEEQLRMLDEVPVRFAHLKLPVLSDEAMRRESIYED